MILHLRYETPFIRPSREPDKSELIETSKPSLGVHGALVSTLVQILIAFFLPPISVLMTNGIGLQFLLNILLCFLFVLPGSIHALWLLNREKQFI